MAGPTNQEVLNALNDLRKEQSDANLRLENKIDRLDCRIQEVEKGSEKGTVSNKNITKTVEDHENRLRELEKLAPSMKLVIWIAGALGLSVVALIWSLITGQAMIVFAK